MKFARHLQRGKSMLQAWVKQEGLERQEPRFEYLAEVLRQPVIRCMLSQYNRANRVAKLI